VHYLESLPDVISRKLDDCLTRLQFARPEIGQPTPGIRWKPFEPLWSVFRHTMFASNPVCPLDRMPCLAGVILSTQSAAAVRKTAMGVFDPLRLDDRILSRD
jgi:hypothetical protein